MIACQSLQDGDHSGNQELEIMFYLFIFMFSGCLMIDCLRSYCLVKLRGSAHLVALGLISMLLLCKIAKPMGLINRIEMRKADCFGKTRLVPHVPSSL